MKIFIKILRLTDTMFCIPELQVFLRFLKKHNALRLSFWVSVKNALQLPVFFFFLSFFFSFFLSRTLEL